MHPGSTSTFYRLRRLWIALAILVPILALVAGWWAVDQFVLTPQVPTKTTPAEECVAFIIDANGLPALPNDRAARVMEDTIVRLLGEESFREAFARTLRQSSAEEQAAFREHVFDAFKPRLMADIRRFHELEGGARDAFVDERLLDFKRLELLSRGSKIDKAAFGDAGGDQTALLKLILAKTTEEERALGIAYIKAAAGRWNEIRQDDEKRAAFEARMRGG